MEDGLEESTLQQDASEVADTVEQSEGQGLKDDIGTKAHDENRTQSNNLGDIFLSNKHFEAICDHCEKFLEDLGSDEDVSNFRTEFINLFKNFQKIFAESRKLMNKILETNAHKLVTDKENRQLEIKLEEKEKKVEELKKDVGVLHSALLKSDEEKLLAQDKFNKLRAKTIEENQDEIQDRNRYAEKYNESAKKISDMEGRIVLLNKEVDLLSMKESKNKNYIEQLESGRKSLESKKVSLEDELQRQKNRVEETQRLAAKNKEEIKKQANSIKLLTINMKEQKNELELANTECKKLFKNVERAEKELDVKTRENEKLKRDINAREEKLRKLTSEKGALDFECHAKREEIRSLEAYVASLTKERDLMCHRAILLDEKCIDADAKVVRITNENDGLRNKVIQIQKELEKSEKKAGELSKQRDNLVQEMEIKVQTVKNLQDEIIIEQERLQAIEKELQKSKFVTDNLKDEIENLGSSKEQSSQEILELNKIIDEQLDEIKRLKLKLSGMEKREAQLKRSLEEQMVKYKCLVEDTRHFRKSLIEHGFEIEQLKDQKILLQKHMQQLQNSNENIDDQRKKLDSKMKIMIKNIEKIKASDKQKDKENEKLDIELREKGWQENFHLKLIKDKEKEVSSLRRKVTDLIAEKDDHKAKFMDKNREVQKLKEGERLLQRDMLVMSKSENDRINDIKLLKAQLSHANRRIALLSEQVKLKDVTVQELAHAQKMLLDANCKIEALEEEIQKPVNVHRWRILEGIDSNKAQLIEKYQTIQKQLLEKNKKLQNNEVKLSKSIQLIEDLRKQFLSKDDIQRQMWICRKELNSKVERLKCTLSENNMLRNLCENYEKQVANLKKQLQQCKPPKINSKASGRIAGN